jgi:hypothetical protein
MRLGLPFKPRLGEALVPLFFDPQNGFSTGGQDGKDSQKKP